MGSQVKRVLFWTAGLLLAIVVGIAAKQITRKAVSNAMAEPASISQLVRKGVEEMNKEGPKLVGEGLRLDRTTAEGTLIAMNFTYINLPAASINVGRIQARSDDLVKGVCGSPDLAPFIRQGASFLYRYHGNDGKIAFEKTVTPASCGR